MRLPVGPFSLLAPLLLVAVLTLVVGCATSRQSSSVGREPSAVALLVARADGLARAGDGRAAEYLYQRVVRESPGDPAAADALYRLGRLEADPTGGVRNYRAALAAFSQLLAEHPESRWAPEAQAWQALLSDLLTREDEIARTQMRLRGREEEMARLRLQLQQLRSVDLDLERRR